MWTDQSTIQDFIKNASHYFRKENETRWYFFHNSFRQFVLDKTSRNAFNYFDEAKHIEYHIELAEICLKAKENSIWSWEKLYHLYHAKKLTEVINIGQQDYFRQQFYNLRPFESIIEDITYVLLAAKQLEEPLPIIRCLFIETELRERQETFDQVDKLQLLFSTEGTEKVLEYIFDGRRLRTDELEALKIAKILGENEFIAETKLIFNAAEPLAYLSGSKGVENILGGADVLKSWVDISHYFLELEDIISTIQQTRHEINEHWPESLNDEELHFSLIEILVNSVYSTRNENKIKHIISIFSSKEEFYDNLLNISFTICFEEFPSSEVNGALEMILSWATTNEVVDSDKLMIAELIFKINSDKVAAREWIKDVKQPELYKYMGTKWNNLSPFVNRIRLNRLSAALGYEFDPTTAVPNTNDVRYQGNVLFERCLVRFANIWGKAWKKEHVNSQTIVRDIQPAFNLFLKEHSETKDWLGWYELKESAVDFYGFAIRAVSQHGASSLLALSDAFRTHWDKYYWPTDWRKQIAFLLYKAGDSREKLIVSLDKVEQEIANDDNVHSRVSAYTDLSIMWAKIDEVEKAQKILPKILKGSFGIYHHKDRQFSHWVSWLGKVVKEHPEIVQEDIRKFSAALVNLELSGRGRGTQEAARDLIAITTSWNIKYGFELVNWLFDRKGLDYGPGLTGLLQGMLNRNNPPCQEIVIFTNKLLIPFEEYNPSDLPELLAYSCHKFYPEPDAAKHVRSIANSISINLLPSNRLAWWQGIVHGLRKVGRDQPEYTSKAITVTEEKHVTHEPSLILCTDEKLTQEEAQLKVNSVESLFSFIRSVKSTDYFHWDAFIKPYLNTMDTSQLIELYDLINPFGTQNDARTMIANKLIELGGSDKAINLSDPRGWDLDFDGGSRQSIFKTLIMINPSIWRPEALRCLVDDYIGEYRYPNSLIWNLEEIVDIIFDKPELSLIWQEITNHIFQLNDFVDVTELTPLPTENNSDIKDEDYLIRLALKLFDIGVPELAHMAYQAIIGFVEVTKNRVVLIEEIEKRLQQTGLLQIKALSILQGVIDKHIDFVSIFKVKISALSVSSDFCVRFLALDLASHLSIDVESISKDRRKLPFAYKIELPELINKEEAIPYAAMAPGETLPDFGDPLEMIRPLSNEAELIAEMATIPFQNIVARTYELMRSLVPEKKWNKAAEEEFKGWLKGIELQLTYQRLRPQIAKLALSYVVCELLDAGRISPNNISFIETLLRRSDSNMLLVEPIERPDFIEVPNPKGRDKLRQHVDWLKATSEALSLFRTSDNHSRIILGELTKWCWLDWEKPTERRFCMVCHSEWPDWEIPHDAFSFFPYERYWTSKDYAKIKGILKPSLVIYGSPVHVDFGGTKWLAFNPDIGISLGWSISPNGLFQWVDKSGEIMVESIFWKDGPIDRKLPKPDNVCSDGWLVVATQSAVNAIRKLTEEETIKINTVIRSYEENPYSPYYETAEVRSKWV